MTQTEHVSSDTIIRIAKDVRDLMRSPIENVVYMHNPNDVMSGFAMILGPTETPYDMAPMIFKFSFPSNYPYSPPHVTFVTYVQSTHTEYNHLIRLHPNYYTQGKCCLSILNTWRGEQWSGCQTIRSVLVTMSMTLTLCPFEHEPSQDGRSTQGLAYRAIVYNSMMRILVKALTSKFSYFRVDKDDEVNSQVLQCFYSYVVSRLREGEGSRIEKFLQSNHELIEEQKRSSGSILSCPRYSITYLLEFEKVRDMLVKAINDIREEN